MRKILILLFFVPFGALAQTAKKNLNTEKIPGTDCDNIIHNQLDPSSIMRSPSECELMFDQKVRKVFDEAFSKVFFRGNSEWLDGSQPSLQPIKAISKSTEVQPYRLGDTDKGDFRFELQRDPSSQEGIAWRVKYDSLINSPTVGQADKLMQFLYEVNGASRITVYTAINAVSARMYFMKGGEQILKIPNTVLVVRGAFVTAGSGGGLENSRDACLILIGKWNTPEIKKETEGGVTIYVLGIQNNSGPHLRVQNISIRIECNKSIQDRLLKEIDFSKLYELTQH